MAKKKWDGATLHYPLSIQISRNHEIFLQTGMAILDYDEEFKHLAVTPVAFSTDGVPFAVDILHMYLGHRRQQYATVIEALEDVETHLKKALEKVEAEIAKRKDPEYQEPGKSLGEWMRIAREEEQA